MSTEIKTALVLGDIHIPYQDRRTMAAVHELMKDHHWDHIVQIGDLVDLDCISSHNDGKPGIVAGKTLAADFAEANAELDRWQKLCPEATIAYCQGNHEARIERLIEKIPQLKGTIEIPHLLRLKERGIKWVPYWEKDELYRIGNLYFGHGRYTNTYHAKTMVSNYGCSIVYGHLHEVCSFSQVLKGPGKTLSAECIGCLCEYNQSYLKGAATKWQQAVMTVDFFPNGQYCALTHRIFDHRFTYNGKVYAG